MQTTLLQAVGEPPLFLAASVYYAIKDAIKTFRREQGDTSPFNLMAPATAERIRMACQDQFTEMVGDQCSHHQCYSSPALYIYCIIG